MFERHSKEDIERCNSDRKRLFKEDGSCTNICEWGYAIDKDTGICICLDVCKKEFCNNEKENVSRS